MEIEVFSRIGMTGFNYQSSAILDSFNYLMTKRNYYKANNFSMNYPLSTEAVKLLKPDAILLINGCFYYIDNETSEDATSGVLKVSGNSLMAKSKTRIVLRNYNRSARPELIAHDHLNNEVVSPADSKRKINYLKLKPTGTLTNSSIQYQNSYGIVQQEVEDLCLTYDFGFKETSTSIVNPENTIEFFKGRDLSNTVEFTINFDNLLSESFEASNFDEMTTAVVFGEGEGSARKTIRINDNLSGLERKELYVDARDLQKTTDNVTLTDAQYNETLKARGNKGLAERIATLLVKGDINLNNDLFEFGKDYDIGDRIRISSKVFGLSKTVLLAGVEETWDDKGHHLTPIWENESPTIIDILKRK